MQSQNVGDITVKIGNNNLPTCYHYTVHDDEDIKILTVKVYDKIIDLVSRDGTCMLGSKINQVISSKNQLTELNARLSRAENTGLTRLEISIHGSALFNYDSVAPSIRKIWPQQVKLALNNLVDEFMNDDELLFQAYRKLNVPLFLGAIGRTPHNILAIGKQQNFLLNARTPIERFTVGTK